MEWFRFYHEALDDLKVQSLAPATFKHWVNLLCLSNLSTPRGVLPGIDVIAFRLRLSPSKARALIGEFSARGLIDIDEDGNVTPHGWNKRQRKSDDVAERVAKHRSNGTGNESVTLPETPMKLSGATETDTESDTDPEQSQNETPPTPSRGKRRPPDLKGFDEWYQHYPRKEDRAEAQKAWAKLPPDERQLAIDAIRVQKQWPQMLGDSKFIPLPTTWLNKRRWESEPPQEPVLLPQRTTANSALTEELNKIRRERGEFIEDENVIDGTYRIGA